MLIPEEIAQNAQMLLNERLAQMGETMAPVVWLDKEQSKPLGDRCHALVLRTADNYVAITVPYDDFRLSMGDFAERFTRPAVNLLARHIMKAKAA